ncbi:branched chain amino acid aminotransferase [Piptocephalis cylindrospora]|uniref:Branched chain amino acid aminotransferase n=1 Tax=Piptocephalis cylindrospora TaxID=1907219 RepID=A0A4P9Y613_9FUNG|nr:branched chain amino acid aminotransferase [Piptocephalis cylindrospora]|eukprot:RKP14184.1 branched chain amino acid aminotransferase [Piptocephalis cylindrospora]
MSLPQSQATDPKSIDWANLGFSYVQTKSFVRHVWRADQGWSEAELVQGTSYIPMHVATSGLHYGQNCFEGLKAFRGPDGRVRLFRPELNATRLGESAVKVGMEPPPEDLFLKACRLAVEDNIEYVPPHGSGGALYVRPLLYGSEGQLSVDPSPEVTFIVFVVPVGDYYKGSGGVRGVDALVDEQFDRAAPLGSGSAKLGGNYAPCLPSAIAAKRRGFPISLYLDAKSHTYVEEFTTSNFIALNHPSTPGQGKIEGSSDSAPTFITPNSRSILRSTTRRTLCELATYFGWKVEERPVAWSEVSGQAGDGSDGFSEVAACGTAVVITPVKRLVRGDQEVLVNGGASTMGPYMQKLYDTVRAIQSGTQEDIHGWLWPAQGITGTSSKDEE